MKKCKLGKLQILALLFFAIAIGSWWLYQPEKMFMLGIYSHSIYSSVIPECEKIDSKTAMISLQGFRAERQRLLNAGQMNAYTAFDLIHRIDFIIDRTRGSYESPYNDYECEYECLGALGGEAQKLSEQIDKDLAGYCGTGEGQQVCLILSEKNMNARNLHFAPRASAESVAATKYKLQFFFEFVLLGLVSLVIDRGVRFGWRFEKVVGRKIVRFAAYSAALVFSLCGGAAVAQQIVQKVQKEEQRVEKLLNHKGVAPMPEAKKPDILTAMAFSDSYRDSQVILQQDFAKGPVLFAQFRRTTDAKSLTAIFAGGWKFPGKRLTFTVFAGPAFNLKTGKYAGHLQMLPIGVLSTRWFQFTSINKLFLPTSERISFGSRHIQSFRGPPLHTPRPLHGLSWLMENWHTSAGGGKWLEFMVGPSFNVGQIIGRPKSFWSRMSVWVYRDFCRPQPGHTQEFDIRVQYVQTFSFAH